MRPTVLALLALALLAAPASAVTMRDMLGHEVTLAAPPTARSPPS